MELFFLKRKKRKHYQRTNANKFEGSKNNGRKKHLKFAYVNKRYRIIRISLRWVKKKETNLPPTTFFSITHARILELEKSIIFAIHEKCKTPK